MGRTVGSRLDAAMGWEVSDVRAPREFQETAAPRQGDARCATIVVSEQAPRHLEG